MLITYNTTQNNKGCSITIADSITTLTVYVQAMGYKIAKQLLTTPYARLIEISITAETKTLEPVTVKTNKRRIAKLRSDTLAFAVKDLVTIADNTIADIIKKLPGIEINSNGTILYNNKPISGLTLDGDDVTQNRYTLASNNIKPQHVDSIQILTNNQRITALQNIVPSINTYINLVISKTAKIKPIINVDVGGGIPKVYKAELSVLLLRQKAKAINLLKTNNTGYDIMGELTEHIINNGEIETIDNSITDIDSKISTGTIPKPSIEPQLWLFNKPILASANIFLRKNKFTHTAINSGTGIDNQHFFYNGETKFNLPNTLFEYKENGILNNYKQNVYLNIQHQQNRKNNYLDINLKSKWFNPNTYADLRQMSSSTIQAHTAPMYKIEKDITVIFPVSYNSYIKAKSILTYANIIEQNSYSLTDSLLLPFNYKYANTINQILSDNKLQTAQSISLIGSDFLSKKLTIGHNYTNAKANTNQYTYFNNLELLQNDSLYKNNNTYNSNSFWADASIGNTSQRLSWTIEAGFININSSLKNNINNNFLVQNRNYFTFYGNFKKAVFKEHEFSLSLGSKPYSYTDILNYSNLLFTNYRSVSNPQFNFQFRKLHYSTINFAFRKSLDLLFIYYSAKYAITENESIIAGNISNNFQVGKNIQFPNNYKELSHYFTLSKYLYGLKTNIQFKTTFTNNWFVQQFNNLLSNINTNNQIFDFALSKKITKGWGLQLLYNYNKSVVGNNNSDAKFNNTMSNIILEVNLTYKGLLLTTRIQNTNLNFNENKIANFVLANANITYKFAKKPITVNLYATNLLNNKNYTQVLNNNLVSNSSNYQLRPLQIFSTISYTF